MNNVTPLLLTAYEKYGSVGMAEYIECFIAENLDVDEIEISDYNDYLMENHYYEDIIYSMDELDEFFLECPASKIIDRINFPKFEYRHDWFKDTIHGLESYETRQIQSEIADNKEFLNWYIAENNLIDEEEAQAIIDECNKLIRQGY